MKKPPSRGVPVDPPAPAPAAVALVPAPLHPPGAPFAERGHAESFANAGLRSIVRLRESRLTTQAPRGGIDLGGTKIQTVVVDADNKVLGRGAAARRRPRAGPRTSPARWSRPCARRPRRPASRRATSAASASARPATPTRRPASSPTPATCPTGSGPSRSGSALRGSSGSRCKVGNDVQVAVQAEFELGAAKEFDTILGVWWGTGVGGGLILDGKPWLGRGAAAEIGHVVVKMGGATLHLRAQGLHGGLRGPHGDGDQGAQGGQRRAPRPTSSRSWRSTAGTG